MHCMGNASKNPSYRRCSIKVIHTIEHESFCYPSAPTVSDTLTFELWDDGDVRIQNEESDSIIKLDDLVDITKSLLDQQLEEARNGG